MATDTPEANAQKRLATFTHIMASLQQWYSDAMGSAYGFNFALEKAHLLRSTHTSAEWDAFGVPDCGIYNAAFTELSSGGLLAAAGLPALGTPHVVYLVVVGGSYRGGCGSPWMVAVEELELDRFAHRCPNGRYDGCDRNCSDPDGLMGIDPWCPEWLAAQRGRIRLRAGRRLCPRARPWLRAARSRCTCPNRMVQQVAETTESAARGLQPSRPARARRCPDGAG